MSDYGVLKDVFEVNYLSLSLPIISLSHIKSQRRLTRDSVTVL